jgi:hypothetical protein
MITKCLEYFYNDEWKVTKIQQLHEIIIIQLCLRHLIGFCLIWKQVQANFCAFGLVGRRK